MADSKGAPPNPQLKVDPATLKTRAAKVATALEGDDEFSVASVDPELRRQKMELRPESETKPELTQDKRTMWRLFRKLF